MKYAVHTRLRAEMNDYWDPQLKIGKYKATITVNDSYETTSKAAWVNRNVEYEDSDHEHDSNADVNPNRGELYTSTESKTFSKNSCLKGIRWDVNAYKDFKEDKFYDSWIKSVKANAKLHGVSQVLK